MGKTLIEWTDTSENPVRARHRKTGKVGWACVKVDPACKFCYSERMNGWVGTGLPYALASLKEVDLFLDEKTLLRLLRSKKTGERTFIGDMTDLFGIFVPRNSLDQILAVVALTPERTYQFLTKRARTMHDYFADPDMPERVGRWIEHYKALAPARASITPAHFPLPNVWLGVSAGNQKAADENLTWLVQTPAAVRYVSCEPLLAGLDLRPFLPGLDLVITGGETGQKYKDIRPVHPAWLRSLRDQCADAGVKFFFKAWGEWIPRAQIPDFHVNQPGMTPPFVATHARQEPLLHAPWGTLDIRGNFWPKTTTWNGKQEATENDYEVTVIRAGKKFTGRLLDGREHNDLPGALDESIPAEVHEGLLP